MLTRQKMLLSLLSDVQGSVDRTPLMKYAFLLRQEGIGDDSAYYDFVPYKYGPFSFALYRDLEILNRDGYLSFGESVSLNADAGPAIRAALDRLPAALRAVSSRIIREYGKLSSNDLLKRIYAKYPWFTINSERADLCDSREPARPVAVPAVYTAGYEGHSVDSFFNHLLEEGIQAIVDVRNNPFSRKYGFAQKSMGTIAGRLGIAYLHFPELGILSELRSALADDEAYQALFRKYETEILPGRQPAINRVADLMRQQPSTLVCMERDVNHCHRGRLAVAVARANHLAISHL